MSHARRRLILAVFAKHERRVPWMAAEGPTPRHLLLPGGARDAEADDAKKLGAQTEPSCIVAMRTA